VKIKVKIKDTETVLTNCDYNMPKVIRDIIKGIIKEDCYVIRADYDFTRIINILNPVKAFLNSMFDIDNRIIDITPSTGLWEWNGIYLCRKYNSQQSPQIFILCPKTKKDRLSKFFKHCTKYYKILDNMIGEKYHNETKIKKLFLKKGQKESILDEIRIFLNSEKIYKEELNIPWKRGIIFYGPPGNGKTLLIKAIAEYFCLTSRNILDYIDNEGNIKAPEIEESTYYTLSKHGKKLYLQGSGIGLYNLSEILYKEQVKPTLFYLEDLDKTVGRNSNDYAKLSLYSLLQFLDGFYSLNNALVIATTNQIDEITDTLVGRPGRFDSVYEISPPDEYQIRQMFDYYNIIIENSGIIVSRLVGSSMAFVEEFIKSAKTIYKKNELKKDEAISILDKMRSYMEKYKKVIRGFGQ